MKKVGEDATTIRYRKASKYFSTKKQAQEEMKRRRKKYPKTIYKLGGF